MRKYTVVCGDKIVSVDSDLSGRVIVNNKEYDVEIVKKKHGDCFLIINNKMHHVYYKKLSGTQGEFYSQHFIISTVIEDARAHISSRYKQLSESSSRITMVTAPMPGLVTVVEVKPGDIIQPGTGLLILEAMKMENEIRSTVHGKIKSIEVSPRSSVEKGQSLVEIEIASK